MVQITIVLPTYITNKILVTIFIIMLFYKCTSNYVYYMLLLFYVKFHIYCENVQHQNLHISRTSFTLLQQIVQYLQIFYIYILMCLIIHPCFFACFINVKSLFEDDQDGSKHAGFLTDCV